MKRVFSKNTDSSGSKDWREDYRGSKAFDSSCRNHGDCPFCECNRKFGDYKRELTAKEELDLIYDPEEYDSN